MNNKIPPRPDSLGARGTYAFHSDRYRLVVKKVVVRPTPRPRKDGRDLKIVFEAYRPDAEGRLARCPEERLAQHVGLLFLDGAWRPTDRDDIEFLEELGIPEGSPLDEETTARLEGRWIIGRPGPRGHDGFNPLVEFESIATPQEGNLRPGPTTVPTDPDRVDDPTPPRLGPAAASDRPGTQRTPSIGRALPNPPPSDVKRGPIPAPGASETDRIQELSPETILRSLADFLSGKPDRAKKVSPRAKEAYASFHMAVDAHGGDVSDKQAFRWLQEHDHGDFDLPDKFENWARYLREARRAHGTSKHVRHARPREARSLVGPDGVLAGTDGKRIVRKKPNP